LQDANVRAQGGDAGPDDIGRYLKLGPLGNAFLPDSKPRVLLIDEIDKSDVDLPNDLLHVFEEGYFEIDELMRVASEHPVVEVSAKDRDGKPIKTAIKEGRVQCQAFPFVILTSNDERELPPAFQRRCLRLQIAVPNEKELVAILVAHLEKLDLAPINPLLQEFLNRRDEQGKMLATDQLLNAVFLLTRPTLPTDEEKRAILDVLFKELGRA
jgi:MoxR-like ATPase